MMRWLLAVVRNVVDASGDNEDDAAPESGTEDYDQENHDDENTLYYDGCDIVLKMMRLTI